MNRNAAMVERLPPIYRVERESLTEQLVQLFGLMLAQSDEDIDRIQRSHWIDHAFDREDLEKFGVLFDLPGAPWEPDRLYRERLKVTIGARLRGAVTRSIQEGVIVRLLSGAQDALRARFIELDLSAGTRSDVFQTGPSGTLNEPAFVEFPELLRRSPELRAREGRLRPFDRVTLTNQGLLPTALQGVLRGVQGGRSTGMVLVNLTNGNVLCYAARAGCGKSLRLTSTTTGELRAELDGVDVTNRLLTGRAYDPTRSAGPIVPDAKPRPIELALGPNELWFFPLGFYDLPGLDVARFAAPGAELGFGDTARPRQQAAFAGPDDPGAGGFFDAAVFYETPAVVADLWWIERTPASYRFEIPAGVMRREAGRGTDATSDRDRIFALLQRTLSLLCAAAVRGEVKPRAFRETIGIRDRGGPLAPDAHVNDAGGRDTLAALSALFDTTAHDGSRFM